MFPQTFRSKFAKAGINIDDFSIAISGDIHLKGLHGKGLGQLKGRWNKQWKSFFDSNPNASAKDMYQQLGKMMDANQLSGDKIIPYK